MAILLLITIDSIDAQVSQASLTGGTLIVVSPNKDGILMCGDKRLSTGTNIKVGDEFNKVRPIGKQGLYAATGHFIMTHKITFPTYSRDYIDFELYETIDHYFQVTQLENMDDNLKRLGQVIVNKLQKIDPAIVNLSFPFNSTVENQFVFQTIFIYVDHNRVIRGKLFICSFNTLTKNFTLNCSDIPAERLFNSLPITMGGTQVYTEILSGSDKRFEDLRADKRLKQFAAGLIPLEKLTAIEATYLSRMLIKVTSARGQLLDPNTQVSPTSDCALLSSSGTINWVSSSTRLRK